MFCQIIDINNTITFEYFYSDIDLAIISIDGNKGQNQNSSIRLISKIKLIQTLRLA